MIDVNRILTIMKVHHFPTVSAFAKEIEVTQSKMSRVMSGEQTLSAESVGIIINKFRINPDWIFGYQGKADTIEYIHHLVPVSELEARDKKIAELKEELGEVYKQLAEERKKK